MNPMKIVGDVSNVLATIATMIGVAEGLVEGGAKGAEKKAYVIKEVTPLLVEHVGAFWASSLGQALIGLVIDGLVLLANKLGNLSTSPATSGK